MIKRVNLVLYTDNKYFVMDWKLGEWFTEGVFCGNHYENRYYITDDFGNLVKVAYIWYGYPYKPTQDMRKDCYNDQA